MTLAVLPVSSLARVSEAPRAVGETETIAGWNFDNQTAVATTASMNNTGVTIVRESAVDFAYAAGANGGKGLNTTGWDEASAENPKYYGATVNAYGYNGITVAAAFRPSNTGPAKVYVQYSINGETFITIADSALQLAGAAWTSMPQVTLPAECDNAESLTIRFAVIDTTAANGGATAAAGTLRIDDVVIAGVSNGGAEPEPTEPPIDYGNVEITDAIAAEIGSEVCVIGTVTFIDGRNVYVEDETGAICVYLTAASDALSLGDQLMAKGARAEYKGLPELSGVDPANEEQFKVLSHNNLLPLQEVTIAQLLADTMSYICERVVIKEATIGAVNTSGNTTLTQNGSETVIYKIPAVEAVEGDTVNVTACVGMFNTMQLRVAKAEDVKVITPIPDPIDPENEDYAGMSFIEDVLAMTTTGGEVTVVGQVAYLFGNFGSLNSILLGDVVDNEIIGLQVYDYNSPDTKYPVGAIVAVTGTVSDYGGVRQVQNISSVNVIDEFTPMAAQEVTVAEVLNNIDKYVSEYVVIRDAQLGAYASSGSTMITDATGTLPIYRAAAYPAGVAEGDIVDVYGAASRYNTTVQLRNGSENDYYAVPTYGTIAEALAADIGTNCTVRGIVTFIDGRSVYVEDATGAVCLYLAAADASLAIGDMVEAEGARAEYNGLPELTVAAGAYRKISSGNALPMVTVTVAELLADPAAYMCRRVKIEGGILGEINPSGNTVFTQDGSEINIYRIPETEFNAGDMVDVIAVVSCYNDIQLRVTDVMEHVAFIDPIPDELFSQYDAISIPEVIALADGAECTFIGQLVYKFGNYDSVNSAILEDIVNGEVVGLQMYNSLDDYQYGDILCITASKTTYGGVPQVQSGTSVVKVGEAERIPAQRFSSFSEMLAKKTELLSEYVMVYDVTLGSYNDNGSTYVTDVNGMSFPIYRAMPYSRYNVEQGEVVDLGAVLSKYSSTDQFRGGEYWGEPKPPVIEVPNYLDAEVGVDYVVNVTVYDVYGVESVTMNYTIGDISGTREMNYNASAQKYRAVIPGSDIMAGQGDISVTFTAVNTKGLSSEASAVINVVDEPQIVSVHPAANSATHEDKTPEIYVEFANAGEDPDIEITVNGVEGVTSVGENTAIFNYNGVLADGKYKAEVVITRQDGVSVSYTWTFTVGEPQFGYYYGQLHAHTAEYSDGTGTLEDVYSYVTSLPESENVDFVAITDHSNYFDTKDNLGDFTTLESGTVAANGHTKWYNYTTLIDEFNTRQNDVIFIGGYEMTWSGQYGHINTYNSIGIVSRQNSTYTVQGGAGLVAYYDLIKQYPDTIHAFNHPGTTFGNFDNFGYYDVAADRVITMVEVGNGEGAVGGSAYWPSYEQYTLALDMGWHVAPTNNQDNHKGKWGNSNTARDVIITDDFSEEGIYEAMRNMTMYATEDKNLELYYTLNDMIMGTIIPDDEENPIDAVDIYVSVNDPDGEVIGRVSVIVNGGITAYTTEVAGSSAVLEFSLPNDYSYYFIRVEQADGDIAVTAPVWVGDVSKVGISEVATDTIIPVKGEAMDFTTSLYDYEADDFVIQSITYSLAIGQNEAVVLAVQENCGTIAADSELDFAFTFTPYALGAQKLVVTVVGYLGETMMQFAYTYEFEVLDPTELIDIGIDHGHINFYVSGNYAGSDAAFIELCAQNAIRSNYINAGELTYDNIKDYKLLVLTVPYMGWQNVGEANLYTEAELEAIAQYASNGGNIVLCSKSDRGNPDNIAEQAHTITNGILAVIGSDTTIANGIVVDNQEAANEAYRIYFTSEDNYTYTWNGEPVWLLSDVLETTNNSFSGYNSAPVIPGANAIPIIKGYSTTWGANYTADFNNDAHYVPDYDTDTVVVPMGQVVEMTLEDLNGGGWLITSGVTFFSTFEVKVEIENATTLQNSNYQIVMNIINKIKPEPEVTPIIDVNNAEAGLKFTVEGYVTSNASGYDQDTAFFDCIYIQDDTAGINLFPVAGNFHIGEYVRATGVLGAYNGEREIVVTKIESVEGHEERVIEPEELSCADAMDPAWTGSLVKVNGTVTSVGYATDGTLETIMVRDETGTARVFIDGYIMSDYELDVQVGDTVSAIGLASITVDTEDPDGGFIPRMRVRNRTEVVVTNRPEALPDINGDGTTSVLDALLLLRWTMNLVELPDEIVAVMDIDGNGTINANDALLYLRRVLGLA